MGVRQCVAALPGDGQDTRRSTGDPLPTTPEGRGTLAASRQIIELLPWSAMLPNGEKVAETDSGFLTRVSAAYEPATQNIKVKPAVAPRLAPRGSPAVTQRTSAR